jgi:ABC-type Co2+ transport system permease subunit
MVNRYRSVSQRLLPGLALAMAALTLFPRTAHAYVDPTSGSIVFQILAAGILGAAVTARHWWAKAVGAVRGLFGKRESR